MTEPDSPTSRTARRSALWWIAVVAWAALIFALSAQSEGPGRLQLLQFPGADKLVHAGVFGLLALLLERATRRPLLALLLASLYGVSDELHQLAVPGRFADPYDWLADSAGASLALVAVSYLRRGRASKRVE